MNGIWVETHEEMAPYDVWLALVLARAGEQQMLLESPAYCCHQCMKVLKRNQWILCICARLIESSAVISVRSSEITSPISSLPTLLIVDAFHRLTVCLVLMAGKILLLSQLPLPKFAEETTWWGTKWCHISHGIIFQLLKKNSLHLQK